MIFGIAAVRSLEHQTNALMKKSALTPDSLLKYAAGVSALVVVSESASAASNVVSFSANQQITTGPAVNFAPFTGGLGTGSPSISQLALQFCNTNLVFLANTGSGYLWLGSSAPYSFTAGASIFDAFLSLAPGSPFTNSLPGDGSAKYFGFKSASNNVGWASVANSSGSYYLTGFGMETGASNSIQAGEVAAIPEPAASVALLALGALGIAALRRRNQAKAAANAA